MILISGLVLGFATPTELGAVVVVYIIFLGLIYREITITDLFQTMVETLISIGALIFIISCAFAIGLNITLLQIPNFMSNLLLSITSTREGILALTVVIFSRL